MGIIAGLGRGMPGRPGAPPSRAAGGRGIAASPGALGAGAGRRPMPCAGANGLLPGRGVPPGRPTGLGAGAFAASAPGRRPARRLGGAARRPAEPRASGSAAAAFAGPGLGAAGAAGAAASAGAARGCRCLGGRRRSLGGLSALTEPAPRRRLLGRLRSGEEGLAVLLLEPHLDGKLDRRGGRLDELAHLLQLLENFLALDAVGLGEFVNSGLSHVSPSGLETRVPARLVSARGFETVMGGANSSESTHRVLMSCLLQSLVGVPLLSDGAGRAACSTWCVTAATYSPTGSVASPAPDRRARANARRRTARS